MLNTLRFIDFISSGTTDRASRSALGSQLKSYTESNFAV